MVLQRLVNGPNEHQHKFTTGFDSARILLISLKDTNQNTIKSTLFTTTNTLKPLIKTPHLIIISYI
jgi:hypothetical protein